MSSAPLISLDGKQQGHGSHRLLTTSSSFARVWRWKKSQAEHHHHVPGIQVYCAFWGKYCSVFRVSRKNCKALQLFPPLVSTVLPSQLGCPQPDNKAMSQKRLEGGMAVNWRAFAVRNLTFWNDWLSWQLTYILPKNKNSTLETAYLKSNNSLPKNHCSGVTLVLECKV